MGNFRDGHILFNLIVSMDIAIGVYSDGLATSEMVTFCLVFDYVSVNDIVIGSYLDGFTTSEMVTVCLI